MHIQWRHATAAVGRAVAAARRRIRQYHRGKSPEMARQNLRLTSVALTNFCYGLGLPCAALEELLGHALITRLIND